VSPVWGDAKVPGSDAPVRHREVGCEAERMQLASPQHQVNPAASLRRTCRWWVEEEPSLFTKGEGHGRHQRSWSGCLGTSRRRGSGMVRKLSSELERSSSAPGLRPG
jgi:hypothetical protein